MSEINDGRASRLRRRQRRLLNDLIEQGKVLVASADTPDREGVRQTVSVRRIPGGAVRVHVEHYTPWEWDTSLDESEYDFPRPDEAFDWLELHCKLPWSQLHESSSK